MGYCCGCCSCTLGLGCLPAALNCTGVSVCQESCLSPMLQRFLEKIPGQAVHPMKFRHPECDTYTYGLPSKPGKMNGFSESSAEEFVLFQVIGSTLLGSRWHLKQLISPLRVSETNIPCRYLQGGFCALNQKIHVIQV